MGDILYLMWYNITYYWDWVNSMTVSEIGWLPIFLVGCVLSVAPLIIGIMKRRYMIAILTALGCAFTFILVPLANILTPVWVALVFSLVQLAFAKKEKSEIDFSDL